MLAVCPPPSPVVEYLIPGEPSAAATSGSTVFRFITDLRVLACTNSPHVAPLGLADAKDESRLSWSEQDFVEPAVDASPSLSCGAIPGRGGVHE